MTMKAKDKQAIRAFRLAVDIHRRCVKLQAEWTAFAPFGAVVYELDYLGANGFSLREAVFTSKDNWDLRDENLHIRPVAPTKTGYDSFKAQIKGIEGALSRFAKVGYLKDDEAVQAITDDFKATIKELKSQM